MTDNPLVVLEFHDHPEGEWCDDPACYQAPQNQHEGYPKFDDGPVMAIMEGTNADLIVACHRLGYIRDDDIVLDPTYGLGRWWTKWRPAKLWASDIIGERSKYNFGDPVDFRDIPLSDGEVDVVAFDPPYKLNGTGGSHPSDEGYGVDGEYRSWQSKHELIRDGMTECTRVLKVGGVLLAKMQDQVCSGHVRWQTKEFWVHATSIGLDLVDELHLLSYRAQPEGRRQLHARRNFSTLQVYRKVKS
jgi:hypothetical protein